MTTRSEFADLHGYGWPPVTVLGARTNADGQEVYVKPQRPSWHVPGRDSGSERQPGDRLGGWLLASASALLTGLAIAMGIVSWHAQFAFIYGIKHQSLAAALEALGLDAGAVIFSVLGIALGRLGRRAVIERVLVCVCAAGSAAMNIAGADLGSPRSVEAYVMPPVLFAITSDRLVSVIRRQALGPKADDAAQRSAWRVGGIAVLYLLRLVVAPPSTLRGGRLALLNATPLPEIPAAQPAAIDAPKRTATATRPARKRRRGRKSGPTKTAQLLALVAERHGPLAEFPLADVSRVATSVAPEVGIHPGSARSALKAAVVAARNEGQPR